MPILTILTILTYMALTLSSIYIYIEGLVHDDNFWVPPTGHADSQVPLVALWPFSFSANFCANRILILRAPWDWSLLNPIRFCATVGSPAWDLLEKSSSVSFRLNMWLSVSIWHSSWSFRCSLRDSADTRLGTPMFFLPLGITLLINCYQSITNCQEFNSTQEIVSTDKRNGPRNETTRV